MDKSLLDKIASALSGKPLLEAEAPEEEFSIEDISVIGPSKKQKLPRKKGEDNKGGQPGDGDDGDPGEENDDGDEYGDHGDPLDKHIHDDKEGDDAGDIPSKEDLEKHGKKTSSKMGEREEGAADKKAGEEGKPQPKADKGGRGARTQLDPHAVDWSSIRPRFNWKDLLAKLVRSADTTEVTYQKVHRRNITSLHVAAQTGAGVIRPGEKQVPANLVKLCIVIDSSGSMHEAIKKVFANLHVLFAENQSAIAKQFALIEFSGGYHIYNCTISGKSGTAYQIPGVEGMATGGGGERIDLSVILGRHGGGSTNFDEALADKIKGFLAKKYNVLIMTDTDIMATGNRETFMDLYSKHHSQVYMLLDSKQSFTAVVQSMKQASANISHL